MTPGKSGDKHGVDTISDRIEKRRADKSFQERLRTAVERNQSALDLLAK